jgi:hypothetical protein
MAIHIRRRDFISLLGGSAAAWPLVARRAMPDRIRRIGYLGFGPASAYATRVDARRTGLRELGWIEGKNIVIEFRWADRVDELPALAAELVRMHVDVIFASSSPWSCRVNLPNAPRRWPSLRRHRTSGWPRPRRKGRKRGRVFIEYWSAPLRVDTVQAARLTIRRACSCSNLAGLRYPSAEWSRLLL